MKTLRNEEQREKIADRVRSLTGTETPVWGKMTVEQMLSHLVQSNELPFESSVPDVSNWMSRKLIKPLMLRVLPMPKEIKTTAAIDQQQDGRKPTGFEADRALVLESIEKLGTLSPDHKCLGHPFFGPMSATEWAAIAHKHIDHHLRQFGA